MADWFIARNGRQEGPLAEEAVRMFISSGQLGREDVVWQQGMAEWTPAGRVPELAALFQPDPVPAAAPSSPYVAPPQPVSYAAYSTTTQQTMLTDRGLDMLRKTKPWARLVGVMILIGAGFMVLAGILMIGAGVLGAAARYGSTGTELFGVTIGGILYLGFAVLYLMPGIYLNRYASRIGDLLQGGREDRLELALEAQKSFWKFVGIAVLLTIVIWIGTILVLIVAGIAGASMAQPTSHTLPNAPHIPAVPHVPNR